MYIKGGRPCEVAYVPRICAHSCCGALALELDVVWRRSRDGGSGSSGCQGRIAGVISRRGTGTPRRRRREQQHRYHEAEERRAALLLLRTLQLRYRLENPHAAGADADDDDDDDDDKGDDDDRVEGVRRPTVMTPAYSTQLVNATLPGPLASFGSAVFPCSAVGVRKWEQRGRGRCQGTRFGDAEGGFVGGMGLSGGMTMTTTITRGTTVMMMMRMFSVGRSKRKGGHFLRRSTASNAGSALPLYCSEHLGLQYPDKPEKELRRIREFWSALEVVAGDDDELGGDPDGDGDDDVRSKGKNKTTRAAAGGGLARRAREWSRRMQAKQPAYWASLIERGLALEV
ncbi:hypothetical protein MN608_05319 [Microdochium nivale]|nr:hypothetical protein MN608_05319 [Microdochium nivale]